MEGILPKQSDIDPSGGSPRVIGIDEEPAEAVLSILATGTARSLLGELYHQPTTLSALADRTDNSVQNATYHVNRLADVGLVEVIDTWYSERGREMDVYAPTNDPLVLVGGNWASESESEGGTGTDSQSDSPNPARGEVATGGVSELDDLGTLLDSFAD